VARSLRGGVWSEPAPYQIWRLRGGRIRARGDGPTRPLGTTDPGQPHQPLVLNLTVVPTPAPLPSRRSLRFSSTTSEAVPATRPRFRADPQQPRHVLAAGVSFCGPTAPWRAPTAPAHASRVHPLRHRHPVWEQRTQLKGQLSADLPVGHLHRAQSPAFAVSAPSAAPDVCTVGGGVRSRSSSAISSS